MLTSMILTCSLREQIFNRKEAGGKTFLRDSISKEGYRNTKREEGDHL